MSRHAENKTNTGLVVFIIIIIIALAIGAYFFLNNNKFIETSSNSILTETITAENYDELTKKVSEELGESDELYYFSYATVYYLMSDGMATVLSEDESAMYTNIYGKTANDLINEGKTLMEENNITVDEWKTNLENASESE